MAKVADSKALLAEQRKLMKQLEGIAKGIPANDPRSDQVAQFRESLARLAVLATPEFLNWKVSYQEFLHKVQTDAFSNPTEFEAERQRLDQELDAMRVPNVSANDLRDQLLVSRKRTLTAVQLSAQQGSPDTIRTEMRGSKSSTETQNVVSVGLEELRRYIRNPDAGLPLNAFSVWQNAFMPAPDVRSELSVVKGMLDAQAPKAELEETVPEEQSAPIAPKVRREKGLAKRSRVMPATVSALAPDVQEVTGLAARLGGVPVTVPVVLKTPEQDSRLEGKRGLYDEKVIEAVINAAELVRPNSDIERKRAMYQAAFGVVHENDHFVNSALLSDPVKAELSAYLATARAMEAALVEVALTDRVYADRLRAQIELIHAFLAMSQGNIKTTDGKFRDDIKKLALQIIIGNGNREEVFNALLNRLQSQVYSIGDERFANEQGVKPIKTAADLKRMMKQLLSDAMSAEHTVFLVPDDMVPGMKGMLGQLAAKGYGIFVYSKKGSEVSPIRWTAEICAQFGKGQFTKAFGEKKDPDTGYLSMKGYLDDKLVKYLLNEILSQQTVASAA